MTTSNYFARPRNQNQFLNSNDSIEVDQEHFNLSQEEQQVATINQSLGCSKCRTGASKLHKSEYDLVYGSRLSTRMQTTAKSAWKSTKKLATSMVTSGVSLTACRHKSASASMRLNKNKKTKKLNEDSCDNNQQRQLTPINQQQQQSNVIGQVCNEQDRSYQPFNKEQQDEAFHTSVIKLEASNNQDQQITSSSPSSNTNSNTNSNNDESSYIHKDQNNKLTIVTKFAHQNQQQQQANLNDKSTNIQVNERAISNNLQCSLNLASSVSCGERSRCESASSGRGTSEDERDSATSLKNDSSESSEMQQTSLNQDEQLSSAKRHKRRQSAVFKANQLLPMKTANSLKSQFKSLFTMKQQQQQQQQSQFTDAEITQVAQGNQEAEVSAHQSNQQQAEQNLSNDFDRKTIQNITQQQTTIMVNGTNEDNKCDTNQLKELQPQQQQQIASS